MTLSLRSCWKPLPLASVEGWIFHSSGGGEPSDEIFLREELNDMFTQVSCREGSYWRSLSFDLEGGIVDGLLGHSSVAMGG